MRQHNATLDGLRGIAAIAVVLGHSYTSSYRTENTPILSHFAVDFFFILSGFVIAKAYDERDMTAVDFVRQRVIRLFPMIVFGTLVGAVFCWAAGAHEKAVLLSIAGLLLVPMPSPVFFPLDLPLWSLFWEFWANVYYILTRRRPWLQYAPIAIGGVILCYIVAHGHHLNGGMSLQAVSSGIGRISWGFFVGILLGRVLTASAIEKLPSAPFPLLAAILCMSLYSWPIKSTWWDLFCVLVVFPIIVALGAKDVCSPRLRRIALLAGAVSYPLYAIHMPFTKWLRGERSPVLELVFMIGIVIFSFAVMKLYDEPVRKWLSQRSKRHVALVPNAGLAAEVKATRG